MSNKSPFEIRLELLQMAKDYLDKVQEANVEFAREAFSKAVALGQESADQWKKFAPAPYTIEELMKQATAMYSFINKKD